MIAKFEEDEKQEQLNLVRRKERIAEFQNELEKQWRLKREEYEKQKEQQLKELEELKKIETERRQLIEQEKERLIRENEELLRKYCLFSPRKI